MPLYAWFFSRFDPLIPNIVFDFFPLRVWCANGGPRGLFLLLWVGLRGLKKLPLSRRERPRFFCFFVRSKILAFGGVQPNLFFFLVSVFFHFVGESKVVARSSVHFLSLTPGNDEAYEFSSLPGVRDKKCTEDRATTLDSPTK